MSARSPDTLEIEVAARPESVARVRGKLLAWLAHRAEVPSRSTGAVALAVSEAVSNAARHAYAGGDGRIEVTARLDRSRLEVTIEDWGQGFHPHTDRPSNGLGMTILARLADEVSLHTNGTGTCVMVAFDLGRPDGEELARGAEAASQKRRSAGPGPARESRAGGGRLGVHGLQPLS